jgi:hypothetical protein
MDWIRLAQDRDQWHAIVYKVMNFRGNNLKSFMTIIMLEMLLLLLLLLLHRIERHVFPKY